jgi:uncharacterized membrane-anchored protein YjiN (DUF445 family)
MIYSLPLPSGFLMAVTEYKLEELLIYQDQEYVRESWERELEHREREKIWIVITYNNVLRAINEVLLQGYGNNIVERFRTKHKYLQKHLDKVIERIIAFCNKHKLKKIPKTLLKELIEYEIERKIIMRNYVRNYKVPYKYPKSK